MILAIVLTATAASVAAAVGVVVPFVTALLTKAHARPLVKKVVTVVLSALSGVSAVLVANGADDIVTAKTFFMALITWGTAQLSYSGLYSGNEDGAFNKAMLGDKGLGDKNPPA